MKKKFIILTITGLLLASLAACGGSKTPDASKNTADQEAMIRKAAATVQKMQAKPKVVI